MDPSILKALLEGDAKYMSPTGTKFLYGTAGFRCKAPLLDKIVFRVGILAVLRSKCTKATIGVMLTASHNPVEDNGVKVVEPSGEMMVASWEPRATAIANAASSDELVDIISQLISESSIDIKQPSHVMFARDTRPSGDHLAAILEQSLTAMQSSFDNLGVLTTPQLHYMVWSRNTHHPPSDIQGYYTTIATAFKELLPQSMSGPAVVTVDCANGVGAGALQKMAEVIGNNCLNVTVCNDGSSGILNEKCGADYVKLNQCAPDGVDLETGKRYASLDGDADRVVFFFEDNGSFRLLDGDKIASLVASFIQEQLTQADMKLTLGVVQTAYANGSSTDYLCGKMKIPVACVPTGVKHLHHKAKEFDIGVYFEANGHGTVLFSEKAVKEFHRISSDESCSMEKKQAASQLCRLTQLINQAVGDALSDLLLVEVVLAHKKWGCAEWSKTYTDLPNRQMKVKVPDRTLMKTTDAERVCVSPAGLQEAIDTLVVTFAMGRSFVRPSGTEDVVRVYAEADTQH
ncbi:phosphoacetylglucosamine mutase-like isoform X2 [Dysidea avara]|uniref:phosphoacetylglucosamine mutase-like isoform X2 n=1 Tax=Dysidea avara TaxID=196820 RepID=UPI00332C4E0D